MSDTLIKRVLFGAKCNYCKHGHYCLLYFLARVVSMILLQLNEKKGTRLGHELLTFIEDECEYFERKSDSEVKRDD